MKILKNGFYFLLLLLVTITFSCDDDDDTTQISGLDFVVATLSYDGTEIGVLPTTIPGNGNILYTVDFGATPDVDTDVIVTSGPMVSYDYPDEDGDYIITVTASLQGVPSVTISKEVSVTFIPAPTGGGGNLGPIAGIWKLAPEAGALGVGPALNDVSWWSSSSDDVATRSCLFDDEYVFNSDGSFQNVLGGETWIEGWQGAAGEECGTPVFPHDGSASATWSYNDAAGTLTIDGTGAFLGLAKVYNGGELGSPAEAASSITYMVTLSDDGLSMELDIEIAGGGYWSFKLAKDAPFPLGTWKLAPEAGALGVGPGLNDVSWWSSSSDDVATRSCLFDDEYVFNADGTFQNVLGGETWVEGWQGAAGEECGTPVFPHDGSAAATWSYNDAAGTLTIDGTGAFLGLAKVYNGGELGSPAEAVDSITYLVTAEGSSMELDIEIAGGGYWSFKLARQ
ncbi:MAG: hypothetical protein HKO92_11225 [Flavobacteriaceae bacterium]|nr:hypothetical protein [Flavobacteriaceae bacterium]